MNEIQELNENCYPDGYVGNATNRLGDSSGPVPTSANMKQQQNKINELVRNYSRLGEKVNKAVKTVEVFGEKMDKMFGATKEVNHVCVGPNNTCMYCGREI
jgi:hypothetical protein